MSELKSFGDHYFLGGAAEPEEIPNGAETLWQGRNYEGPKPFEGSVPSRPHVAALAAKVWKKSGGKAGEIMPLLREEDLRKTDAGNLSLVDCRPAKHGTSYVLHRGSALFSVVPNRLGDKTFAVDVLVHVYGATYRLIRHLNKQRFECIEPVCTGKLWPTGDLTGVVVGLVYDGVEYLTGPSKGTIVESGHNHATIKDFHPWDVAGVEKVAREVSRDSQEFSLVTFAEEIQGPLRQFVQASATPLPPVGDEQAHPSPPVTPLLPKAEESSEKPPASPHQSPAPGRGASSPVGKVDGGRRQRKRKRDADAPVRRSKRLRAPTSVN